MKDREALISQNIGLVHFVIKRFSGKGHDMEELFQVGCVGLCKAVDHFDESLGLKLSTYAVPVIVGEIKRYIRDNTQIHISRGMKEKGYKIHQVREEYEKIHHREPTLEEISQMTGFTMDDIVVASDALRPVESLDGMIREEQGMARIELLKGNDDCQEKVLRRILCEEAFKNMTHKEREFIHLRYFENVTQSNVARHFHMSQVQVSRMEKKILLKLRQIIG